MQKTISGFHKKYSRRHLADRGFTLVELALVVAVIAILATITIVAYNGTQARARDSKRKTDVANIIKAMELYYSDFGRYPATTGSTAINNSWVSSNDASWAAYDTLLKNASAIDALPTDPKNYPSTGAANTGVVSSSTYYSYAIYVNTSTYCGAGVGQMYLIVYRYETMTKEKITDGACTVNAVGDSYYNGGASYYRNSKVGL